MYLRKEDTEKDRQMKMQMLMTSENRDSSASECICLTNGFFGDQRSELTVSKQNFPENTLIYSNQGVITNLKAGDRIIYLDYVVIAPILPASVCWPNIEKYKFAENKVLLLVPLYNTENGYFKGLKNGWGT